MSLHGSARHFELAGDFGVVTTLQKQFDDLLFARSQPNGLLDHHLSVLPDLNSSAPMYNWSVSIFLAPTMPF
jgi:hypothetical protein